MAYFDDDDESTYNCSIITSSSLSTESDLPGPGRIIDKYVYQPAGRIVEGMANVASGIPWRQSPGHPDASAHPDPQSSGTTADPHHRTRRKKPHRKTHARNFWFHAVNAHLLSECSLATVSSTGTRTDITGPGRIIDKYVSQVVGKMIENCLGRIALKVGPNANEISKRVRAGTPFYVEGFALEFLGWRFSIGSSKLSGCMKLVAYARSNSVSQRISALRNIIFLAKECAGLLPFLKSDYVLEAVRAASMKRIGGSEVAAEELRELNFWAEQAVAYLEDTEFHELMQYARECVLYHRLEHYPLIQEMSCVIQYAIIQAIAHFRTSGISTYNFTAARYAKDLLELTSFFGIQNLNMLAVYGHFRATVFAELLHDVVALIVGLKCGKFRGDMHPETDSGYSDMYDEWIFEGVDYQVAFGFDQFFYEFDEIVPLGGMVRLRRLRAIFDLVSLFHKTDLKRILPAAAEDALLVDWKTGTIEVLGYPRQVVESLWEDCLRRADKFVQVSSLTEFEVLLREKWMHADVEHESFFASLVAHSGSILENEETPGIAELFGDAPYTTPNPEGIPSGHGVSEQQAGGLNSSTPLPKGRSPLFKGRLKLKAYFNK